MGTDKVYHIYGKDYKPLELSAYVLSELKMIAEKYLQEEIEEAVITVPAYFNDKQRSDTKKAAQIAGLRVERLINEPSAAALAYQMQCGECDRNIIVFDFGGGTLDLSYVECFDNVIEIVAVAGDNYLGGDDVDQGILEYVCEKKNIHLATIKKDELAELRKEIVEKKKLFATENRIEIADVEITNDTLIEICMPLFSKIRKLFLRLLEDAQVTIRDIDDLIMVGGSSRLPVVKQFLTDLLGKEPIVLGDTDKVVAMGAGTYAGIRQRVEGIRDYIMTDVCPFTLGVETFSDKTAKKGHILPIIERNSTLPTRAKERVRTLFDFQEHIKVKIYQGEDYFAENNLFLGDLTIDVVPRPAGQEWVDIQFMYDINGILQVAVSNSQGKTNHILLANQTLTEEELKRYQEEMQTVVRMLSPWEDEEYASMFRIVNEYYETSLGEEKARIGYILEWYENNLNSGRMKVICKTVARMREIVASLQNRESMRESILFNGELKRRNDFEEEEFEEDFEDEDFEDEDFQEDNFWERG